MNTSVVDKGSFYIAKPRGSLNGESSPAFEQHIREMPQKSVILNMQELEYISSAGLRAVLIIAKELKANDKKLILCNLEAKIRRVFDMAGFLSIIDAAPSQEDAIERLEID